MFLPLASPSFQEQAKVCRSFYYPCLPSFDLHRQHLAVLLLNYLHFHTLPVGSHVLLLQQLLLLSYWEACSQQQPCPTLPFFVVAWELEDPTRLDL